MKKKKMKPLTKAIQLAQYHPVFNDMDAQSAEIIETVFCVIREYGLDVHTWMTEYNKACAANGGMPPQDLERFLPWNMTAAELARFKKRTPVDFTDMSSLGYIWAEQQKAAKRSTGTEGCVSALDSILRK